MTYLFFAAALLFIAIAVSFAPVPEVFQKLRKLAFGGIIALAVVVVLFSGVSYNDAGYCQHIRTIFGSERSKCDLGWFFSGWGQQTEWPHYITIANTSSTDAQGSSVSPPYKIRMADQWNGDISQTTRFGIPQDETQFLKMARDFRSPERMITTTLRPAVTSSLDSVANLYSMEDYWTNGKRDEFKTEFEAALKKGRPAIDREDVVSKNVTTPVIVAPSNSAAVDDTADVGTPETTRSVTKKRLDANGMEIRIAHDFVNYGISISSAIIEQLDPDDLFESRIQERKEAASRRIIAREQRLEQEELRLLTITKSERDMAERQGQARVEQIEKTTNAETDKRLALVQSEKIREQAKIEQQTAEIQLARARIDADAIKVTADAEAYKKKQVIEADNALTQKLETEVKIQQVWAEAFSKRLVPSIVLSGSGEAANDNGDASVLMKLLTIDAAKRLFYDRSIGEPAKP